MALTFDELVWIESLPAPRGFSRTTPGQPRELDTNLATTALEFFRHQPKQPTLCSPTDALPFPLDVELRTRAMHRCYLPLWSGDTLVALLCLARRENSFDETSLQPIGQMLSLILQHKASSDHRDIHYLREEAKNERDLRPLTGESQAMKLVRRAIQQVAPTDSTVLIAGETGTGKELVARAIHQLSPRRDHLLVKVNCAALGANVITSELFGHEQGAFTGAVRRRVGRFELAHQGTIFLDEIGEVPPDTQVLLLRVLQERILERVGGNAPIPIDVRIVAATNQDLEKAVREGRFRADLYYRLNVFPLRLPPLRDRPDDIPSLVSHFIQHFERRLHKRVTGIDDRSLELLRRYPWPGNVRELENVIERAMIVSTGPSLSIDPTWLATAPVDAHSSLAQLERDRILDALQRSGGRIYGPTGAAAALGLKPTTLYGKLRKHRIDRKPS